MLVRTGVGYRLGWRTDGEFYCQLSVQIITVIIRSLCSDCAVGIFYSYSMLIEIGVIGKIFVLNQDFAGSVYFYLCVYRAAEAYLIIYELDDGVTAELLIIDF